MSLRQHIKGDIRSRVGNDTFDSLMENVNLQEDHIITEGTAPSMSYLTAGNGTATLSSTATDTAGRITFAGTWANGDFLTLNFNKAYNAVPVTVLGKESVNASGADLVEIDTFHYSTTGSTIEASGTCVGSMTYVVVGNQ
tara:strand:+ start:107 stop:526 length:420 start_codon:yes stop_codon:yes gene_type:complete